VASPRARDGEPPGNGPGSAVGRRREPWPLIVETTFPPAPSSVARARRLVDDLPIGLDAAETAKLLVSELVSNAVTHAKGPITVSFTLDTSLRVEVGDESPDVPFVLDDLDSGASRGRGMQIVERLASRWGVERRGAGKAVWFTLPTGVPPEA
jgi:anti-sigma regulatory factor (Ser/Thr protein kinase)